MIWQRIKEYASLPGDIGCLLWLALIPNDEAPQGPIGWTIIFIVAVLLTPLMLLNWLVRFLVKVWKMTWE